MNVNIVAGHLKAFFGACQQVAGGVLGNRLLAAAGRQRSLAGKGQLAVGEAQQIIKNYIHRFQLH